MAKRLIAAMVGLAIVLPVMIFGGLIGVQIVALVALLIGLDEYARMAAPDIAIRASVATVLVGGGVFATICWAAAYALPTLALAGVVLFCVALYGTRDTDQGALVAVRLVAGLVYLPLLLSFIPALRSFDHGLAWIFLLLTITWLGDTGAYFAGRSFGKTKLFERVSPKKTWEGVFGGALAAVVGALVVKAIGLPDVGWVHVVAIALIADAAGVTGDLVESLLKRWFNVKDSGWIMPGHGGILDRVDSLLFSAPVMWAYATVFGLA